MGIAHPTFTMYGVLVGIAHPMKMRKSYYHFMEMRSKSRQNACQVTATILYSLLHLFTSKPKGDHIMQTVNPDGQFNNYAVEPQIYYAEYPNSEQQKRYALQGAISALFVTALFPIAFGIS